MMRSSLVGFLLLLSGALAPTVHAASETAGSEPGSVPLSPAVEQRLERYLTRDKCPVTLDQVLHNRCQYLLKKVRVLLSKEREGSRLSPRAGSILRTVERGRVIQRSIGGGYHSRLGTAASALYLREQQGGFRRRLRTIKDVEERYEGLSVERSRGETRVGPSPPPAGE